MFCTANVSASHKADGRTDSMELTTTATVCMVFEGVVGVVSIVGNYLVLIAIHRYRILHTATNYFIGSLAMADLLVGIAIIPVGVLPRWGLPNEFFACVVLNTAMILFTNVSILSLIAITIDRYFAIGDPLRYNVLVNTDSAKMWIGLVWLVAILLGSVPLFWHCNPEGFDGCHSMKVIDMRYMVYLVFFVITLPPLVIMIVVYSYIYVIMNRKLREGETGSNDRVQGIRRKHSVRRTHREARRALGLFYVLILYAVAWLPLHTLNCVILFKVELWQKLEYRNELMEVLVVLSHSNSMLNPFLYALSNVRMKRAIIQTVNCSGGFRTINSQQSLFTIETSQVFSQRRGTRGMSLAAVYLDDQLEDTCESIRRGSRLVDTSSTSFRFVESTSPTSQQTIDDEQFLAQHAELAEQHLAAMKLKLDAEGSFRSNDSQASAWFSVSEAAIEHNEKPCFKNTETFKARRCSAVTFASDAAVGGRKNRVLRDQAKPPQFSMPHRNEDASHEKRSGARGINEADEPENVIAQTTFQTHNSARRASVNNPARSASLHNPAPSVKVVESGPAERPASVKAAYEKQEKLEEPNPARSASATETKMAGSRQTSFKLNVESNVDVSVSDTTKTHIRNKASVNLENVTKTRATNYGSTVSLHKVKTARSPLVESRSLMDRLWRFTLESPGGVLVPGLPREGSAVDFVSELTLVSDKRKAFSRAATI